MGFTPATFSADSVTFYVDGFIPYSAHKSLPNYEKLVAELRKPNPDNETLISYTQPAQRIAKAVAAAQASAPDYLPAGRISVTKSAVLYDGVPVKGVLVDRILALLADGFDIMPMVRFMENLYLNPATYARDELYLWLETSNLPITEDGCFLAYKRVLSNFTSIHDRRTKNDPGTTVSMPRQAVDPVRDRTCSTGLHFCSKEYLPSFGSWGNGHKTVLLKINPADVVSIPSDYNNSKGRAWKYEVLREITQTEFNTKVWAPVVTAAARPVLRAVAAPVVPADTAKVATATAQAARASKVAAKASTVVAPLTTRQGYRKDSLKALGIVELRRRAARAGLKGAWSGHTVSDLAEYLARKGQ